MAEAGTQTDASLATAMRISITRLARRLRVERLGLGGSEAVLSDIQLAALANPKALVEIMTIAVRSAPAVPAAPAVKSK